ncbi:DNA methyltransferase [Spirulina major]|uniref:DNA methyltransferase n=1 Tax=Spirulina major TaxID=270636 RepID=UPI000933BB2B|nr:DNA methyltransferase [Spirulina major]
MQFQKNKNLISFQASKTEIFLKEISEQNKSLIKHFLNSFVTDNALTRKLVSFQGNKVRAYYRWYKYKEAFSADLVEYLFRKYSVPNGKILDPFAGAGTSLFAVSAMGYSTEGIELLPVGQKIITANILTRSDKTQKIIVVLKKWLREMPWNHQGKAKNFEVLRITDGAYSQITHQKIRRYLNDLESEEPETKEILFFALLCILESISYTRKDGQYLRWDYRSEHRSGKSKFDKGKIYSFDESIIKKLNEIIEDMSYKKDAIDLFSLSKENTQNGKINLHKGSCLNILPSLKNNAYSGISSSGKKE